MMRMRTLAGLIVSAAALLVPCGTAAAQDKAPEEVLRSRGLTKVGRTYVLEADARLPEALRKVLAAKKAADDNSARRVALEKDIAQAKGALADLEVQLRNLSEEILKKRKADVYHRNKLAAENNILKSRFREAQQFLEAREKELSKLSGEPHDAYAAAATKLADEMEAAAQRYEVLAADKEVLSALAAADEKDPAKLELGPSEQFKRELVFARNQRGKVTSGPVRFKMAGGVPQVMVTLNNSLTIPMIFDSGAASVSLTADVASQLGLKPGPKDPVIRLEDASGKVTEARIMTLRTVRLGTFTVENVPCAVKPASIKGAECLLGGAFLRHFVYRMDLAAGELHMTQISGKPEGATAPTTEVAPAPVAGPKVEESFKPLFNGRDLTGWTYGLTPGGEVRKFGKGYQVRDGAIFRPKGDGGRLYTERDYADFVLRFEFRLAPDAESGVAIRTPASGEPATQGMEIQILDNDARQYKDVSGKSKLRPEQLHGSIHNVAAARPSGLKPAGEWNSQEIRADGRRIVVVLNGNVILSCDLDSITDEKVLKRHPGLTRKSGRIGFLGAGGEVEFRNVRIKEL